MIDRNGGVVVVHCDTCPEEVNTEETVFSLALAGAKRDGWRAFLVGDEWCHACPACAEKL